METDIHLGSNVSNGSPAADNTNINTLSLDAHTILTVGKSIPISKLKSTLKVLGHYVYLLENNETNTLKFKYIRVSDNTSDTNIYNYYINLLTSVKQDISKLTELWESNTELLFNLDAFDSRQKLINFNERILEKKLNYLCYILVKYVDDGM